MGRKRKMRRWAWLEDGSVVRWAHGAYKFNHKVIKCVDAHTLKEAEAKLRK